MSLLLEALKKAEKAKEEPSPGPVSGGRTELSLEQEPLLSERGAYAPETEGLASAAARGAERRAADQLFAAKSPSSRRGLAVAGGALLIAVLAGAGYLWYEISVPKSSLVVSGPRTVAPAPPPAGPTPAAPAVPAPEAPAAVTAAAPEKAEASAAAPAVSPAASPASPTPGVRPPAAPPARQRAARTPPAESAAAPPGERIRFQRSQAVPAVDPDLAAGYRALSQGDAQAARVSYERSLRADPASRDAMLGLAAVEARQGNTGEALRLYQRVLELDPRDPMANAGLVALRPPGDSAQAESRLKLLLAQHPESSALHFTLGNLYAGQSRWAEAQQEYFRAYSLDASNADYAFNLAVSLDQLNQRRLAADHYRKALALGGSGTAGFDRAQAERRLQELDAQR